MNKIKYIFFDLGSTLLDEDLAWKNRVERTIQNTSVTYDKFYADIVEGNYLKKNCYTYALEKNHLKEKLTNWDFSYESIYPHCMEILDYLKGKYNLGVISNHPPLLDEKLKRLNLINYFSVRIGSEDYQVFKPDQSIFRLAMKMGNVQPDECVMIGDRIDNDIEPAKKCGMKTIWIRQGFNKESLFDQFSSIPDYIVYSLEELKNIL